MILSGTASPGNGTFSRGSGAFSLVELLAVVGVISILVGIALPSVIAVRERGRLVNCQGSLRGLATGMVMYAGINGGHLPPGPIERAEWPGDPDRGSPFEMYARHRIADADLSSRDGWYGFGLIWKCGYVDDGKVYYCPSAEKKGGIGYAQAWPGSFDGDRNPADGKSRIFGTYAYRGGLSSQAGTAAGPLNLYRNSGTLAIIADNPCAGRMWHNGGYNVAFLDTHVEFSPFGQPIVTDGHLQDLWMAIDAWE